MMDAAYIDSAAARFATALRVLYAQRATGAIDPETALLLEAAVWEVARKNNFDSALDDVLEKSR